MSSHPTSLTASVLRPRDLLALRFEFVNLTLRPGQVVDEPPRLVRITPDAAAYLLVHFPPQHVAEETLLQTLEDLENAPADPPPPGTPTLPPPTLVADRPAVVQSILANGSQLAFRIPEDVSAIPFTLDALLDWRRFDLVAQTSAEENRLATRLEIPYRLILTPSVFGDSGTTPSRDTITWTHSPGATPDGWNEIWHARIATKVADKVDHLGAPLVNEIGPWPILP